MSQAARRVAVHHGHVYLLWDAEWHFAPHEGADTDEGRIAAALGGDDDLLATCAAAVAAVAAVANMAVVRPATTADMSLALAELVAAELVEFVEPEVFGFVAELEESFEALWGLEVAAAERCCAGKGGVCGGRTEICEYV